MTTVEAQLRGVEPLKKTLQRIRKAMSPERIMDTAQAVQLDRIRKRFLNTEDTSGRQWPVSQAARKRAASGRDGKTLFDTGTLFHSISAKRISTLKRSIGTNVEYAQEHQEGLKGNPPREFIGINQDDVNEMIRVADLLIQRSING